MPDRSASVSPDELLETIAGLDASRRHIVAIAGAPGSGKSTFSERLVSLLNEASVGTAAILPMDGYHYDDTVLTMRGHRPRKGAPHTFDIGGFAATLRRLRDNREPNVAVPVFDRSIEIARAGARIIERQTPIVIAEGNYLLLDDPDWAPLREFFDVTVFLDVPEEVLRARLTRRWIDLGLTGAALEAKLDDNDLPNMMLVTTGSVTPDYRVVGGSAV
ncbi:AAA family ATPase [Fulvimarina sp. 2208YS6-2-32]|uniref:AAA family ATPase n=1 Tax=Fulvimarina uroteuthidis TaxID=3098149 RepID=A0ABU5HX64_9HYPH|nr:AAA family ATPase [Fulvimarina sp. 2208YS6-2-32]MDY8107677.1 AAA family ATPase [Fulvimarina sp. 2208YS6-2-32]